MRGKLEELPLDEAAVLGGIAAERSPIRRTRRECWAGAGSFCCVLGLHTMGAAHARIHATGAPSTRRAMPEGAPVLEYNVTCDIPKFGWVPLLNDRAHLCNTSVRPSRWLLMVKTTLVGRTHDEGVRHFSMGMQYLLSRADVD